MSDRPPLTLVSLTMLPEYVRQIYEQNDWAAWQDNENGTATVRWAQTFANGAWVECTPPQWLFRDYHDKSVSIGE